MIIFQVINNIAVDNKGGGAELFVIRLLEQMHLKFDCHLIIVWQYHTQKEIEIINKLHGKVNIHFLFEGKKKNTIGFFSIRRKFKALVRKYSPNIINSHSALPDLLNASLSFLHTRKIHSVRTMHTDIHWIDSAIIEWLFINLVFPIVFDKEIAISKATKKRLDNRMLTKLTKNNSDLIYNGISTDLFDLPYKRVGLSKHSDYKYTPLKILSVGRLSHQKGYEYLLKAVKLIENEVNYKLLIVGDGPTYNSLITLSKNLGLETSIEFLGFRNDVLEIMAKSHIFVSSSLWEGFPTVVLEAMAIGLPIIATNVSGSRELITDNKTGLLVPVRDPEAIAKAIVQLVSNPEFSENLISNANEVVKKHTITKVARKYAKVYRELVFNENN